MKKLKTPQAADDADLDNGDEEGEDGGEEELPELSKPVLRRVVALKKEQELLEALDGEYKKERIELEKKYLALRLPYYETRRAIVNGDIEPPALAEEDNQPGADVTAYVYIIMTYIPMYLEEASAETDEKGIPDFWLNCLSANSSVGYIITEEDEPALRALTDIKCEYDETFTSYTLFFYFKDNEYFTNSVSTPSSAIMAHLAGC